MRKLLGLFTAVAAMVLTPCVGVAQITVDNFSLPVQPVGGTDYVIASGTGVVSNTFTQSSVDAIGGTRIYYAQKTNISATSGSVLDGLSGTQTFRQNTAPNAAGRSKLLYGYSAVNTASLDANNYVSGHTFASLNLNASTGGGVALDYSLGGSGSTGSITVTLISGTGGSQQVSNVTLPIVTTGGSTLTFTNAAFLTNNGLLNLSDIDQVVVSLDGAPAGVNATIDNVRFFGASVPEPTSIALIGLSIGACASGYYVKRRKLLRRRRR